MRERLTIRDLKDYLDKLEPKFDSASVAILKPGDNGKILKDEIAVKESLGLCLSPTTDIERQAILSFCSREDMDKIEEIYKQHKEKYYGKEKEDNDQ